MDYSAKDVDYSYYYFATKLRVKYLIVRAFNAKEIIFQVTASSCELEQAVIT